MKALIALAAILTLLLGPSTATAHDPTEEIARREQIAALAAAERATNEIAKRDQLIAEQERLLNTYRCILGRDTQLVPGGCRDQIEPDRYVVPVYYCTPQPYTQRHLERTVARLNARIGLFFSRESSGHADVRLTVGGIVNPDGVDWERDTMGTLHAFREREIVYQGRRLRAVDPCTGAVIAQVGTGERPLALILADVEPSPGVAAYATYGSEAVVPLQVTIGDRSEWGLFIIAHEFGHSLLRLDHTEPDCEASLMHEGGGDACYTYPPTLEDYRIVCRQRNLLAWPCETE